MAGKYGSPSVFLLVDGYALIAMKLQGLRHKVEAITTRADGLGDSSQSNDPTGVVKAELAQEGGFFDTTALSGHAALAGSVPTTPQTTPRVVCIGFAGQTSGAPFRGLYGAFSFAYEVLAKLDDLTKANASYVINGAVDQGTIIQPLATKSADWNTKSLGTQVDYVSDTTQRVIPITSASKAAASVVTTTVPHGLTTGDIIFIASNTLAGPAINGQQTVTVTGLSTFTVAVNTTASTGAGTGGTFVRANNATGGVGYLQVTSSTGFTNFVGKLRDSPDDTTYADLIAFTDSVVSPHAERATVPGVVDRYISFDGDVTGSGSITVFCGFARNP